MDQSDSAIEKPSREPFNKDVSQIRDKTITSLVGFYFSSIIVAVIVTTIQIWVPARLGISGISKDILAPVVAAIGVTFSYGFIKDKIAAEFDAGTSDIKRAVKAEFFEDKQKMLEQINGLDIKYALDFKYLAYIKPSLSPNELRLQDISPVLRKEYLEDTSSTFESKLNAKLESNKTTREASYIIAHLPDTFLHQIAVEGIARALDSEFDDVIEQTYLGNKLYPLRTDISVYLTAWLICSIDNDMGEPMPIDYIGMRYTGEGNVPSKEIYKKVIRAIVKIIAEGEYKVSKYYPDDDPLSSESVRNKINDCLKQLINLIEKYPSEEVEF
jgi:hypothetical protein